MTLTDLVAFITSADTSTLDADRAAAIATIRSTIGYGSPVQYRMDPDILGEASELPALTYQLIDDGTGHTLDGPNDGLFHPRVQIDVWAATALDRWNLAHAVRIALDGLISELVNTPLCVLIWQNAIDTFESDRKQYRQTLDFIIWHN